MLKQESLVELFVDAKISNLQKKPFLSLEEKKDLLKLYNQYGFGVLMESSDKAIIKNYSKGIENYKKAYDNFVAAKILGIGILSLKYDNFEELLINNKELNFEEPIALGNVETDTAVAVKVEVVPTKAFVKRSKKITYKVKSGDTLGHIAEKYNTRAAEIRKWNNMGNTSNIYPNQKLSLFVNSKPDKDTPSKNVYIVRSGDTLSGIADKHNLEVSKIREWNSIRKNSSRIYPGQKLTLFVK